MARAKSPSQLNELKARLSQVQEQALTHWQSFGERERFGLSAAGAVVAVLIAWSILLAPAMRTLKTAPVELEDLEAQLQQMQAQALEVASLRQIPPVPQAQALDALKASVDHLGAVARLELMGDRATVKFTGIGPGALQGWLVEVRSAARARPVEVQLQRSGNGFNGAVILTLGGGN
jgi:general secretion pathway protein M